MISRPSKRQGMSPELSALLFSAATILPLAACSSDNLPPSHHETAKSSIAYASSISAGVRQTDADGRQLPFTTQFPDRWSKLNDGTAYEPCTALNSRELTDLGLNPTSVRDAAIANHQTARGCSWELIGSPTSIASQDTGNSPPLSAYKRQNVILIDWEPDIILDGRIVAIGTWKDQTSCTTNVQSGSAIVTTSVSILRASINELCAKAIAFTKATIGKMPP